jgi:D-alanyl-D-alanine carboxypeptidase/D-alanyl-D-alanine-endopeptidase (penicillin-binding protein 4)
VPEGDTTHPSEPSRAPRRRRGRKVFTALVVVLVLAVAAGAAAWRFDLAEKWGLVEPAPDPTRDPAAFPAPPGLELPAAPDAAPVARTLGGEAPLARDVRRALGRLTQAKRLGKSVAVVVADAEGHVAYREGPRIVTPASTMKLLTTTAALEVLGADHRFTTEVVRRGGRITLVGGGDPLLARKADPTAYPQEADLTGLATDTARALRSAGTKAVRLGYDDSLFQGPAASPAWEPDYLPDDVVSPISALWADEGRERDGFAARSADPARDAAAFFADQLRKDGIRVRGSVEEGSGAGRRVAAVRSAPLDEIVQHVLEVSDNEGAEVLARQVAVAEDRPASFTGAARAVEDVLTRLGVPLGGAVINDGSGLSRDDRLRPTTLLDVLATAGRRPELGGVLSGLPVAGFSGSLAYRFADDSDAALGMVRAKTGTLVAGGVHGYAGFVTGRDGTLMTFVAIADEVKPVNTDFVRTRLDQIAAALAGCRCSH